MWTIVHHSCHDINNSETYLGSCDKTVHAQRLQIEEDLFSD